MKIIKNSVVMLVALVATFIGVSSLSAQAQGSFIFNWTENKSSNVGDILITPLMTNTSFPTTAINLFTAYHSEFVLNDTTLTIARQITDPGNVGSVGSYFPTPVQVQSGGTIIDFIAWLNPSAQPGSSENIYNIVINGIPVSETLTANSDQPFDQFQYISGSPIVKIDFDYSITAVCDTFESGIGVDMPATVPEPTTLSLFGISAVALLTTARRKPNR